MILFVNLVNPLGLWKDNASNRPWIILSGSFPIHHSCIIYHPTIQYSTVVILIVKEPTKTVDYSYANIVHSMLCFWTFVFSLPVTTSDRFVNLCFFTPVSLHHCCCLLLAFCTDCYSQKCISPTFTLTATHPCSLRQNQNCPTSG
jgi:hypothetical protein